MVEDGIVGAYGSYGCLAERIISQKKRCIEIGYQAKFLAISHEVLRACLDLLFAVCSYAFLIANTEHLSAIVYLGCMPFTLLVLTLLTYLYDLFAEWNCAQLVNSFSLFKIRPLFVTNARL